MDASFHHVCRSLSTKDLHKAAQRKKLNSWTESNKEQCAVGYLGLCAAEIGLQIGLEYFGNHFRGASPPSMANQWTYFHIWITCLASAFARSRMVVSSHVLYLRSSFVIVISDLL